MNTPTRNIPAHVIFDFFGVICSEIAPVWFHAHAPTLNEPAFHREFIRPVDAGERAPELLFAQLAELSGQSSEQVQHQWHELIRIDDAVVQIIAELRARGSATAICSNAWVSFIRPILHTHTIEPLFDVIIISSEIGVTKPDPAIFTATLRALNTTADTCVHIDDAQANVTAAESLGMHGILFTTPIALRNTLGLAHT